MHDSQKNDNMIIWQKTRRLAHLACINCLMWLMLEWVIFVQTESLRRLATENYHYEQCSVYEHGYALYKWIFQEIYGDSCCFVSLFSSPWGFRHEYHTFRRMFCGTVIFLTFYSFINVGRNMDWLMTWYIWNQDWMVRLVAPTYGMLIALPGYKYAWHSLHN